MGFFCLVAANNIMLNIETKVYDNIMIYMRVPWKELVFHSWDVFLLVVALFSIFGG